MLSKREALKLCFQLRWILKPANNFISVFTLVVRNGSYSLQRVTSMLILEIDVLKEQAVAKIEESVFFPLRYFQAHFWRGHKVLEVVLHWAAELG